MNSYRDCTLLLVVFPSQIQVDPGTGKETKRKRLGGAYPGHRPPQHQPFKPSEAAYHEGGNTATQHFVAYGGGNALTLARPDGSGLPPSQGMPQKEYIQGMYIHNVFILFHSKRWLKKVTNVLLNLS